jgi:ubiquinone/menaquinone biosynthesis C-methylase UbiE
MQTQSINQKRAEVQFRKLLSQQHQGKKVFFPNEMTANEMEVELTKRIDRTQEDFLKLIKKNICISPFLEIGTEYGIRAAFLTSNFKAHGYGLDIAQAPLESAILLAKKFNFNKLPRFICADAYHLPFADNSFPFVFCYQTLHHFPNPQLIIEEIYRVLKPGGYFFFNEEPVSQKLNLHLFRRPTKLGWQYKLLKYTGLLPFISDIGKTETDYGILETSFSLSTWQKILSLFTRKSITIEPLFGAKLAPRFGTSFLHIPIYTNLHLALLGGGISAVCQKNGRFGTRGPVHLICPDDGRVLKKKQRTLYCLQCRRIFSWNKVLRLLPKKLEDELYG